MEGDHKRELEEEEKEEEKEQEEVSSTKSKREDDDSQVKRPKTEDSDGHVQSNNLIREGDRIIL